jgi:hypothetical protein
MTAAVPNPGSLANGEHTVTAAVDLSAGGTEVTTASFTVDNGTPPPPTQTIVMSTSADRSSPVGRDGQTVSGNIYVFVTPPTGISQVRFFLDDPTMSGAPDRTDSAAPFDLVGNAKGGNALPFDTTGLGNGAHSVSAQIIPTAGGTAATTATFTVSNGGFSLVFTPTGLSFALEQGETGAQPLSSAPRGGPASFNVSDTAPWLTVTPAPGIHAANLSSVDAAGSRRHHTATISARRQVRLGDGGVTMTVVRRRPLPLA